ncbi:MAG: pitrilysin family protein [Candidatus Izemoplasma sp.]
MNIKRIKAESYNLSMVHTKKFKTTRIQINFLAEMNHSITARGLLPYILRAISEDYPTREALSIHLEDMYAAQTGGSVSKIGKSHIITFDLSIIDDQYTSNNESLLKKGMEFLSNIIFRPLFDETIFKEEARLIEEYFEGIYADKLKYAMHQMMKNMFKDELYRVSALGSIEELKKITLEDVKREYQAMISTNQVYITVVGNIDFAKTEDLINSVYKFNQSYLSLTLRDTDQPQIQNFNEIIEESDVNQSKLIIGYRTNTYYKDADYYPALIFNAIFGGTSESLLFNKIREEMGKVYFISTSYDPDKGVLFIYSGISSKDYEEVATAIDKILTDIINQDYSDKLLETIKTVYKNNVISSLDSTYSLIGRYFRTNLFDIDFNQEDVINKLLSVTKEEISLVAKKLTKDTVFLLKDDNHEKV